MTLFQKHLTRGEYPIFFSFNKITSSPHNKITSDNGFSLDKKGKLHVDLKYNEKFIEALEDLKKYYSETTEYQTNLNRLTYSLLDLLIHKRTHPIIEEQKRKEIELEKQQGKRRIRHALVDLFSSKVEKYESHSYDGSHHNEFFKQKAEVRRIVCDYLNENGINPAEYIESILSQGEQTSNVFYHITLPYLNTLLHMTRRRLNYERKLIEENLKKPSVQYTFVGQAETDLTPNIK